MRCDTPAGVWSESAGGSDLPTVVVVHGSMDRSAGLLRLSRRLDTQFHVVRYDRRGYGRSRSVGPPWTIEANVEDLAAVVAAASATNDAPVALFGHSFGGNVVMAFAARRPDVVSSVVVYETPLSWFDWWPGNTAGGAAMIVDDPGDAAEAFMRRLVGDAVWDHLPAAKQADRRAEGAAMVAELADLRRSPPWNAGEITMPLLALYGEHARPHHRDAMGRLAEMLANCRSEMVADAGHAGPHTHADAVASSVVNFITSSD
ncbi:MAG TPA: alpha/beta hydrolase [Ilumatobacteraceae bacterium]|nr:alpha/beta hydrolase [Ilumatobacteraceae bacterium]